MGLKAESPAKKITTRSRHKQITPQGTTQSQQENTKETIICRRARFVAILPSQMVTAWPEAGVNRRPLRLLRAEDKNTKKIGFPPTIALSYSTATSVVTHFRPTVSLGCAVYMASNATLVTWDSLPGDTKNLLSPSAEFLSSQNQHRHLCGMSHTE